MSLSTQERQALRSIEEDLSGSDPKLVSLLATFTRLTAGEDMPAREKTPAGRATTRHSHRRRRPPRMRRLAGRARRSKFWQAAGLVIGLLIAVGIVVGALAITGLLPRR